MSVQNEYLIPASVLWSWQEVSYSYRSTKAVWDFDDDITDHRICKMISLFCVFIPIRYDLDEGCLLNIVKAKWVNGCIYISVCCLKYVFDCTIFQCTWEKHRWFDHQWHSVGFRRPWQEVKLAPHFQIFLGNFQNGRLKTIFSHFQKWKVKKIKKNKKKGGGPSAHLYVSFHGLHGQAFPYTISLLLNYILHPYTSWTNF